MRSTSTATCDMFSRLDRDALIDLRSRYLGGELTAFELDNALCGPFSRGTNPAQPPGLSTVPATETATTVATVMTAPEAEAERNRWRAPIGTIVIGRRIVVIGVAWGIDVDR